MTFGVGGKRDCQWTQALVVILLKHSEKTLASHGFLCETILSTITVDNFVDSWLTNTLNPFPTKEFLTLIKKVATKIINKYNMLKKMARPVDSRAIFLLTAPFLCISRKIRA